MLTIEMTDERGRSATRDQIDTLCANGFDAEGITKKGVWLLMRMIRGGIMLVPRSSTAKLPPTNERRPLVRAGGMREVVYRSSRSRAQRSAHVPPVPAGA